MCFSRARITSSENNAWPNVGVQLVFADFLSIFAVLKIIRKLSF